MPLKLTNSQYDGIMNMYQELRFNSDTALRENRSLAYRSVPELKVLDRELVAILKTHKNSDIEAFVSDLNKKRIRLLRENGYPSDFLEKKYHCRDCRDTGYIEDENRYCHCFRELAIKQIYGEQSWLNLFKRENFDTFDLSLYEGKEERDAAAKSLKAAKRFAASVLNPDKAGPKNLLITGTTGVGKTFLCNCIAKELIENDKFVVYITARELFEAFDKRQFQRKENSDIIGGGGFHFNSIYECDLLIIDDLGSEFSNHAVIPMFLELINKRLNYLPTLISTNLGINEIDKIYSLRVTSRLIGNYEFIKIRGKDIRMAKSAQCQL